MKVLQRLCGIAIILAGLTAFGADLLTVAVFDFESKDDAGRDTGGKLAGLLTAAFSATPQLITVERAELEKALGEQELGLAGTVSSETAAKVGHLTGAKVLVTGRIFKVEKETVVISKIIGTETGRVYAEMVKGAAETPVTDLSAELAKKIARILADQAETLVAKVQSREQRMEDFFKTVKPGKRPTVTLKVPERHYGAPVNDPAAETELGAWLQRAGFTLMDPNTKETAEIEITGEAFSAFGLRKGNLVACKARVEVKVVERKTNIILLLDRQNSVVADIAEQAAAKRALQNAAGDLAERVIRKLTAD